ncbi:MAG: DMT family transporter [Burkholderiaceae bacterium]|nr:DMT family transporter [Burkholderiaceae bacterium]
MLPIQWLLLAAMAVWGLNLSAVKALTENFDVMTLASVRMVVAVAALTVLIGWRCGHLPRLSRRQLVGVAGCAVLMVYGNQILFAAGLERSTATHAALIMALSPMISSLLTALVFGERLSPTRTAGIVLGFAGVAAVVLHRPSATLVSGGLGDLLLLCSVASFAAGGVAVQRLADRIDPLAISWAVHVAGTALLLFHTAWSAESAAQQLITSSWRTWALVLFSGIVATALCAVIWNRAIASIGAARTTIALYWVPIFGVAFAVVTLGEPLTAWHLLGLAAVLTGSFLGAKR